MNIRIMAEEREKEFLGKYAFLSCNSKGRPVPAEEDEVRMCFQRDRDKILHSKEFRRLKHKTQVFSCFENNDHLRTRLIHSLEVTQVARTIARALKLNEDLTEAAAMGHDLGHCAFSHSGERVLNKIFGNFNHSENSARIAEKLNLSYEVIDAIRLHSDIDFKEKHETLESKIVVYSDKFAYLNADMDDGIRMGLISEEDIPSDIREFMGDTAKKRLNFMICDIIKNSFDKNEISMSEKVNENFKRLRRFMFEQLYFSPEMTEKDKAIENMLVSIYECEKKKNKSDEEILDFMSGMSDSYARHYFNYIINGMSF